LAVFSLALRWPSLGLPLDRDEGVYASIALAWHQGWGLPYLDFLDHKPPLLYGLYWLAFQLGGWQPGALRLFCALWQAATALGLGLLLRRWTRSQAVGLAGGLACAVLGSAWGSQAIAANAEGWALLPLIIGLAFLRPWEPRRDLWRWSAWGAAAALAACIKQPYYLFALGLPFFFEQGPGRWRATLSSLLGLALVHAPLLIGLAWLGALGAWWQWVFVFHSDYGSPLSLASWHGWLGLLQHLRWEQGALWVLALWGGSVPQGAAVGRSLQRVAWICLSLGLLASALAGRWYPHYAVFWVLGLALSISAAFQDLRGGSALRWRVALALVALLTFAKAQAPFWMAPGGAARSERLLGLPTFGQAPQAAAWVRSVTTADDRLLVWGAEAELYFLAQRRPAGRFLSHYAFTGENPAWPAAEAELMAAVLDPRTKAVILSVPLDQADALQARLGRALQAQFIFRRDIAPPFWTGLRRP
jgi:hypothetical protein